MFVSNVLFRKNNARLNLSVCNLQRIFNILLQKGFADPIKYAQVFDIAHIAH